MRFRRDHAAYEEVQDLEAYLQGRYVDRLVARGRRVPAWAWLNRAAHGAVFELRLWSAVQRVIDQRSRAGSDVERYVVAEVLDAVDAGWSLAELQHEVLVPFELDAAASHALQRTPTLLAREMVRLMDAYIDEHGEHFDDVG